MNRFLFALKTAILRYWQIILIISTIAFFELFFVPINKYSPFSFASVLNDSIYTINLFLAQSITLESITLFSIYARFISILILIVVFLVISILVIILHKKRPRIMALLSIPFICLSLLISLFYLLLYAVANQYKMIEYYYSYLKFDYGFYLIIASSVIALLFAILTLYPVKIPSDSTPIIKIRRIPSRTRRLEELEREVEELRSRVNS